LDDMHVKINEKQLRKGVGPEQERNTVDDKPLCVLKTSSVLIT